MLFIYFLFVDSDGRKARFWCGLFFLYVLGGALGLEFFFYKLGFSRATARLEKGCIHTRPALLDYSWLLLFSYFTGLVGTGLCYYG